MFVPDTICSSYLFANIIPLPPADNVTFILLLVSNHQYLYFAWKCLQSSRPRKCSHEDLGGKLAAVDVWMGKSCDEISGVSAAKNFVEVDESTE